MTNKLSLKTNLNCSACIAAVKPYLDGESSITRWSVDTATPDKVLTVEGPGPLQETARKAVESAGFKVLGDVLPQNPETLPGREPAPRSYYPLVLLLAFLVGLVGLVEITAGVFAWERAMRNFMGGFFLAFSFFKLLDIRGFAESYRMYDVVGRRFPAYGYIYPFIELFLGVAYVIDFQPLVTNLATLAVMLISVVGVTQSLLAKRKIRCACLGTVFNLPMSTVTFLEDALMAAMAALMLFLGSHSSPSHNQPETKGNPTMLKHNSRHDHDHSKMQQTQASLIIQTGLIREAGQPSTLQMMIHDDQGRMVKNFNMVHEAKVHLILVREGLDTFAHLHPEVDAQGNLVTSYTFPKGGTYRLYADLQPGGQSPMTATAQVQVGGNTPAPADLHPNVPGRVQGEGLSADMSIEEGMGREYTLRFDLLNSDGKPIHDLQPYLGALGHLVILSSDGQEYVHAHPLARATHDAPNTVKFHAAIRQGGLYKGWGQFKRGEVIHVVPFVLQIEGHGP